MTDPIELCISVKERDKIGSYYTGSISFSGGTLDYRFSVRPSITEDPYRAKITMEVKRDLNILKIESDIDLYERIIAFYAFHIARLNYSNDEIRGLIVRLNQKDTEQFLKFYNQ